MDTISFYELLSCILFFYLNCIPFFEPLKLLVWTLLGSIYVSWLILDFMSCIFLYSFIKVWILGLSFYSFLALPRKWSLKLMLLNDFMSVVIEVGGITLFFFYLYILNAWLFIFSIWNTFLGPDCLLIAYLCISNMESSSILKRLSLMASTSSSCSGFLNIC